MTDQQLEDRATESLLRRHDKASQREQVRRAKEAADLAVRRRLHADLEAVLKREAW